jgi:spermidine synthase
MQETEHQDIWVGEDVNGYMNVQYKIKETLFEGQSDFQKVALYDTYGYGRMLFNDNIAMLSERDEFIYHDMIAHVPLFTHPNPKKVLVIGGGDGGTVREVLRHPSVEKAVLVEIDGMVIEACKEFLPQVACGLDHPHCEVHVEDGATFVQETEETFDIVLVDSTDQLGPSMRLFNLDFYTDVFHVLSEGGICVSQAESPYYYPEEQAGLLSVIGQVFPQLYLYHYANLAYPGGMWCFSLASKIYSPLDEEVMKRVHNKIFETKYYSSQMHRASFVLPSFLEKKYQDILGGSK